MNVTIAFRLVHSIIELHPLY